MLRIALGGISHETNTYADSVSGRTDLDRFVVRRGDRMLKARGTATFMAGFLDACDEIGAEPVPTLWAYAEPVGHRHRRGLRRVARRAPRTAGRGAARRRGRARTARRRRRRGDRRPGGRSRGRGAPAGRARRADRRRARPARQHHRPHGRDVRRVLRQPALPPHRRTRAGPRGRRRGAAHPGGRRGRP